MPTLPYKLFPEPTHFWSGSDYGCVLDAVRALQPKRVLEFGPGSSTLALIEGGAERIDTCEDNAEWAEIWEERLVKVYPQVCLHRYDWAAPLSIPALDELRFDLALIDGPHAIERRPDVVRFALLHCTWLLVPLEEDEGPPYLRAFVQESAAWVRAAVDIVTTGPHAGSFALVGPTR